MNLYSVLFSSEICENRVTIMARDEHDAYMRASRVVAGLEGIKPATFRAKVGGAYDVELVAIQLTLGGV